MPYGDGTARGYRTLLPRTVLVDQLATDAPNEAKGEEETPPIEIEKGMEQENVVETQELVPAETVLPEASAQDINSPDLLYQQKSRYRIIGKKSGFRPDVQSAVEQVAPQYGSELGMARRLVQVGLDVSRMGSEMCSVALLGATILHSSPLATSSSIGAPLAAPLISVADLANVEGAMTHALYYRDDIQAQMSQVQLNELPISNSQKTQLSSALGLLPKARDMIVQAQGLVGIVGWLLGIGHERRFLVQTMDRAELRPSGGFTGQYGILDMLNGRMAPFTLRDVAQLDYNGNGSELGRSPPAEYSSWMKFGNWELRDSNLSGDYPMTARLSMQVFQQEGGGPVDGDISFTPVLIEHVLDVVGPVKVAEYMRRLPRRI